MDTVCRDKYAKPLLARAEVSTHKGDRFAEQTHKLAETLGLELKPARRRRKGVGA